MRKYLIRASMTLFLVSMLLPTVPIDNFGYTPGIVLALLGISTVRYIGENPFAFLCWFSNVVYLYAFLFARRNLLKRKISSILAVVLTLGIWLPSLNSWEVLYAPAYQAWISALSLMALAQFVPEGQTQVDFGGIASRPKNRSIDLETGNKAS